MNEIVTVIDLADDSPDEVVTLLDEEDNNKSDSRKSDIKKLLEKCFVLHTNADESKKMVQVFNVMITPAYKQLDENYKKSKSFEKVLNRTLQLFQTDPSHKFTHIRDLYETMKLHKVRKKVNFFTLEKNITDVNTKRKTDSNDNIIKKRKKDDEGTHVIDLENNESNIIVLDDRKFKDEDNIDNEGSNLHDIKNIKSSPSKCRMISELVINEINDSKLNDPIMDEENAFLIPRNAVPFVEEDKQSDLQRILTIEREMEILKKKIAYLDEQEVKYDNISSPYILSERYKAKIVELYRELCELNGTDSVKHCKVRLSVKDGHSSSLVRRLERKLNQDIGSSGEPNFPDFNDVIKCVIVSNEQDELGWSKSKIIREATSLFTQCGRALQKRRQEREWRHLMTKVKQEQFDDPAENDPELEARLQENRRIAMKKEADILERFTMMQDLYTKPCNVNNKVNDQIQNGYGESVSPSTEREKSSKSIQKAIVEKFAYEIEQCANGDDDGDEVIVKREPVEDLIELLENLDENYTTSVKEIEDPSLVIEVSSDSSSDEE